MNISAIFFRISVFAFGLGLGLFLPKTALAASNKELLLKADSLHKAKNTEKAWEIYRTILQTKRAFSPKMLLRMALYAEAKGNLALSLYYLNTLYQFAPTEKLKEKIKLLAQQTNATGYTFSELDFAVFTFRKYYTELCLIALGATLLILTSILYNRIKGKPLVYRPVFFASGLIVCIVVTNFNRLYKQAVVIKDPVILRAGPASSSQMVAKISAGHRIFILERQDVWLHTNWGGNDAWIHNRNVELIEN